MSVFKTKCVLLALPLSRECLTGSNKVIEINVRIYQNKVSKNSWLEMVTQKMEREVLEEKMMAVCCRNISMICHKTEERVT